MTFSLCTDVNAGFKKEAGIQLLVVLRESHDPGRCSDSWVLVTFFLSFVSTKRNERTPTL